MHGYPRKIGFAVLRRANHRDRVTTSNLPGGEPVPVESSAAASERAQDPREVSVTSPVSGADSAPDRRLGLALLVIASAQLMVVLDATIVNVALPHVQSALGFSGSGLEWVVNAYAVTFGGLLLLGGILPATCRGGGCCSSTSRSGSWWRPRRRGCSFVLVEMRSSHPLLPRPAAPARAVRVAVPGAVRRRPSPVAVPRRRHHGGRDGAPARAATDLSQLMPLGSPAGA
jgi:hypothetical protein